MVQVFERFSDRARQVIVLAQEQSRLLGHSFIGPEHLLLGMLAEGEGIAARALESVGVTLERARAKVELSGVARGAGPTGTPPFTPQAKKMLEMSLREALQLQHDYIGTEHLLLGLLCAPESSGVQTLRELEVEPGQLRQAVIEALASGPREQRSTPLGPGGQGVWARPGRAALPMRATPSPGVMGRSVNLCSFCQRDLWEVERYVSAGWISICSACIEDAQNVLATAGPEETRLFLPPRVFGEVPDPLAVDAVVHAISDPPSRENTEAFDELAPYYAEAARRNPGVAPTTRVTRVRFLSPTLADIEYELILGRGGVIPFTGQVRKHGERWMRTRSTTADLLGRGGINVSPASEPD